MISFIKQCSDYAHGRLNEEEILKLWAETLRDEDKSQLLEMELMLFHFFQKRE